MTITFAKVCRRGEADTTAPIEQIASAHVSNAGSPLAVKLAVVTSCAIDELDQSSLPLDHDDNCFNNVLRPDNGPRTRPSAYKG
jgi:hypothetical protein